MLNDFPHIGNLALYDGWKPNYVYFSSLLQAGMIFNPEGNWNGEKAGSIAAQAIADANAHSSIITNSPEDSTTHFLLKFSEIIIFLKKAITFEQQNEKKYFAQKMNEIKSSFTREEIKTIKPLAQIVRQMEIGYDKFDYDAFITLINVLMSGVDNAKAIASHESKRITEINKILSQLIESRENQVRGLYKSKHKDGTEEQLKAIQAASDRLKDKITVEYMKTKQLTRQDKNGKYVLFGGKQFKTKIKGPVADVLGEWAKTILDEMIAKPALIQEIVSKMQVHYPIKTGNFKLLSEEIRQTIILGIIQYGLSNLNTVLNKELDSILVAEVERELVNNNTIFDTSSKYNIHGLDGTFGQRISESALFKKSESVADLMENHATEIFDRVKVLIQKESSLKKPDEHKSYLTQTLEHTVNQNSNKTALEEVEEIIKLIESITELQDKADKMLEQWKKDTSQDLTKDFYLMKDKNMPITITIHEGEIQVDMKELISAIKDTDGYKYLGLKQLNPTTLKSTLTSLKRRASLELKKTLIESTRTAITDGIFSLSEAELVTMMGKELESLTININGPTLAELLPGIQFSSTSNGGISINWNGKINGKNDMVVIEIRYNDILTRIKTSLGKKITDTVADRLSILEDKVRLAQENFLWTFQQQSDAAVKELTTSNDAQKYSKMLDKTVVNMHRLAKTNEDLAEAQAKVRKAWQALAKYLRDLGADEDELWEMKQRVLNTLRDSFQISTTVKSYNTYVNNLGFGGGSLGSNLDDQLNRLSDIFESANTPISDQDKEWLRSAIINCFPGSVVGEKNKNLIENYLGSLAAFALFDEGGAEETIISEFYKTYLDEVKQSQSHAKILHLYAVNGIYVPGSYVLQKTIELLENDVLPNLQDIPNKMRQGAGVMIINHASEKMIPNRPIAQIPYGPVQQAWQVTGEKVAGQVQIKILFLAGLLDIVNSINAKLGSVSIPA